MFSPNCKNDCLLQFNIEEYSYYLELNYSEHRENFNFEPSYKLR